MAMFREHVAVGAILSMVVVVAVYFYALVTDPLLLLFLFGVTVVGSFLPDVDSDSGMPFYLVFGTMTLAATGVVLLYTLDSVYAGDWRYLTGIPAAALLFLWFIVGGIVKRCTHHRGIFHSIPALVISGLGSFLIARHYGLTEETAWIFGGAMAVGYLCHLVLDEIHAGITLDGIPFNPKSSFGSALKLFSDSGRVNTATYVLLAALMYVSMQTPVAEAIFYNDSEVIEIGDGLPPEPEEGEEEGAGGSGESGGGGAGSAGGASPGSSSGGSSSGGSSSGSGTSGGSGGTDGGSSASEGGSGADSSGGGSGSGGEGDLISTLLSGGALGGGDTVFSSGGAGGAGGDDGGIEASGAASFSVSSSKVRSALSSRFDLKELLGDWSSYAKARSRGKLTGKDLGLIAASTALSDSNLGDVSFTASAFTINYRSRGYLFSVFPISFPVRVEVVPLATAAETRVMVKLPWYRFFVRKFFTRDGLARDIDSVVSELTKNADASVDTQAQLFEGVTLYLKKKVGTISDSVLLGT